MDILELLRDRRPPRAFDTDRPVDPKTIDTLVEAFRWSPSSFNRQPWRLIVVKDRTVQETLHRAMSEWNRSWIAPAPLLIAVLGNPSEQEEPDGRAQYMLDCGLAIGNLLLQGAAMGLAIHPSVGWEEEEVKKALGVPEPFRVVAIVAVGRPGRTEDLPEALREAEKKPRARKEAREIVSLDRFGNPMG